MDLLATRRGLRYKKVLTEIGLERFQEVCTDRQCNAKRLKIWYQRDNLLRRK
jgi:hypothetical protein